ncbi:phage replication protein CRI [mine drainage metagenome]|uniref:Phage replication protein CRI n=1 Tax=mine drainage metagenome TaxID=410659 RepID=A0A1J5TFZ9_9ZZZZ
MLIDWLTLRFPLTDSLGSTLHERIMNCVGKLVHISPDGEIVWEKGVPDWEKIRSDSLGLFWSITADADSVRYLTIGGSPSSQLNGGVNVFGSLDIGQGAQVLIETAGKALGAILPHWKHWQCRRVDVTANYDMGNDAQVKQALRLLLGTDAPRRRTNSDRKGGDTVYWNPSSDLRAGKAYHKGAHLRYQQRKGNIVIDEETLQLADNLLRLELKLGSRWFRRLNKDWRELSSTDLATEHENFFSSLIGGGDVEVHDMGTLLSELEKHAPTKGRARSAHNTWALIKTIGYTQAKESIHPKTFANHCVWLRAAGISSADLCAGVVLPFRKRVLVLNQPVLSWSEIQKAA